MGTLRNAVRKALWVTKGAALFGGAVVTLALVLGAASTALAGTGVGARFDLGKTNVVDAVSELRGSIRGPMLSITNQNTGKVCDEPATERLAARSAPGEPPTPPGPVPNPSPCTTSPAPALGLNVSSGQTPMTVNPSAGTATNLSADELDGKDSSSFASAANGQANDADKLDGKDSSQFLGVASKAIDSDGLDGKDSTEIGVNGLQQISATSTKNSDARKSATATCPAGKIVVGTGYQVFDPDNHLTGLPYDIVVYAVYPSDRSVLVEAFENEPTKINWQVTAIAICATAP